MQFSRDAVGFDPQAAVWGDYRPQAGLNRWWVRQIDEAGNASTPVAIAFTLDTSSDTAVRLVGPASASFTATAGAEVTWTVEFTGPMHVAAAGGRLPGLKFSFRGRELLAVYREGSGTNRLTYAYRFTPADAGTGALVAPDRICLCYGGTIADAAGNTIRRHAAPPATRPLAG